MDEKAINCGQHGMMWVESHINFDLTTLAMSCTCCPRAQTMNRHRFNSELYMYRDLNAFRSLHQGCPRRLQQQKEATKATEMMHVAPIAYAKHVMMNQPEQGLRLSSRDRQEPNLSLRSLRWRPVHTTSGLIAIALALLATALFLGVKL